MATKSFKAVADARVEEGHASSNYKNSTLGVDGGTKARINSHLTFTTSGLSGPVTDAWVRLRVRSNGTTDPSTLWSVTGTWTESKLTWKNQPAAVSPLSTVNTLPANSWVDFNVTNFVRGNGTYRFVLKLNSGTDGAQLTQRERADGPQLFVTTGDDPPPPTTTTTTTAPPPTTTTTTTSPPPTTTTTTTSPPPPPPPVVDDWRAADIYGGGYQNYVRFHPSDPSRLLLNTDVAGIHLSTDGGTTWRPVGRNVADRVATVLWHPTRPNVAYALAGSGTPGTGGLMVSEDGGETWRMDSLTPTTHSNVTDTGDGLPRPHPRSTGQLLAADVANGFLYAGTYEQGLMRAPLTAAGDPGSWITIALPVTGGKPYFIRGIAQDDTDPTIIYVATYGSSAASGTGRIYRVSAADTAGPVIVELASPRQAEELRVLNGHLYAVANDSGGLGVGAFRLAGAATAGPAAAWRRIAAGPSITSVTYYGLEIYEVGGTTTLWVTTDKAWRPTSTSAYKPLWRGTSADDFATDGTWAALPDELTDTPNDLGGPNAVPKPWWAIAENNYAWLGNDPIYTASAVTVSPTDPGTLVMAGQGGPWRSRDNGATWYPVATGIGVLVQSRVTADPTDPGRVYSAALDYRGFSSTDGFATQGRHLGVALKDAGIAAPAGDGWSIAVDAAAPNSVKPVYFGLGERDINTYGQVWMDGDPSTPTTGWTQVLDVATSGGNRPIGLAVVRDPANPDTPIVLAVLQGQGMMRKVGTGPWQSAAGFTSPIINGFVFPQAVEFAWRPGWTKAYVYDRSSGLWRSDDFGATWTRLYTSPDTGTNRQGFLAAHPTNQNIVYLSTSAAVSVIANAGTAGAGGATLTPLGLPVGKPGPVGVGPDGRIYAVTQSDGLGGLSHLWAGRLNTAGTGVSAGWTDVADDLYHGAVNGPREMSVGPDGTVYLSMSGGVFVLDGGAP